MLGGASELPFTPMEGTLAESAHALTNRTGVTARHGGAISSLGEVFGVSEA